MLCLTKRCLSGRRFPVTSISRLRPQIVGAKSVLLLEKPKFYCAPPPQIGPKIKLPETIRKYGPTFLALSLVIAPTFLLITYVAVSAGLMHHLAAYFPSLATPQYQTAGSFAIALLIHKMWSPIRISFIVLITPHVAQMTKENSRIARILDGIVETVPLLKTIRDVWWVQFLDKIQMSKLQEAPQEQKQDGDEKRINNLRAEVEDSKKAAENEKASVEAQKEQFNKQEPTITQTGEPTQDQKNSKEEK